MSHEYLDNDAQPLHVEEILFLRSEVARLSTELMNERKKSEIRRSLLLQARSYILEHQNNKSVEAVPAAWKLLSIWRINLSTIVSRFPTTDFDPKDDKCLSKAALEQHILRSARRYVADIEAIVLDFSQPDQRSDGVNWRLAGVVCGRADREDALEAIRTVIASNASKIMMEG